MRFLLWWDGLAETAELFLNVFDLISRGVALLRIQFRGSGPGEPPLRAVDNRGNHLQVAQQFGAGSGGSFLLGPSLRFEKQIRRVEDALADSR